MNDPSDSPSIQFLSVAGSRLAYRRTGTGSRVLLLFHGFGQNHEAFDSWNDRLSADYTIYSFDLFFHGESQWPHERTVEKKDWREILEAFLQHEQVAKFDVAAFSMGGKYALATAEYFPDRLRRLILLAPDGIKVNFWYRLATYPIITRALFQSFIVKPGPFYSIVGFFERLGLVSKYLRRFAEAQMDTEEKRTRVCHTWVYLRHLKFNMQEISRVINTHSIQLLVLVGQHDKVIPASDMNRLLQYVPDGRLQLIETGHNQLIEKAVEFIVP